jgi:peptidyl-prolyl cis-trans isomerase A (cyclophilin A)
MQVERRFFLSWVAAVALAAAGCVAGSANSNDPAIEPVDSANGTSPDKKAPDEYWVKLETSRGDVDIEVHRNWSPFGADRFYQLVQSGYYDGCRFFRVIPGFMAQTGLAANPSDNAKWKGKGIPDDHLKPGDPNLQSNHRGYVTFAKSSLPNSRTTQFFVNTGENANLDEMGFTPFGQVLNGLSAIETVYSAYREQPRQDKIDAQGNAYLNEEFPKLDSIKKATLLTKRPAVIPPVR